MDRVKELRRKAIIRRFITALLIIIPLALLSGGIYCLASFDAFRISDISVSGNVAIKKEDVISFLEKQAEKSFFGRIFGKNHILAWDSLSKNKLSEEFLRIKEADINREDRNIKISIKEKKEFLIWCYGPEGGEVDCVWTDDKGNAFSIAPDSEGSIVRVIYDRSEDKPNLGKDIVSSEKFGNMIHLFKIISDIGIYPKEVSISGEGKRDVILKIDSGQEIYFDSSINPDSFVPPVLSSLMSSGEWPSVSYVDLRIEGKGFYRLR